MCSIFMETNWGISNHTDLQMKVNKCFSILNLRKFSANQAENDQNAEKLCHKQHILPDFIDNSILLHKNSLFMFCLETDSTFV